MHAGMQAATQPRPEDADYQIKISWLRDLPLKIDPAHCETKSTIFSVWLV